MASSVSPYKVTYTRSSPAVMQVLCDEMGRERQEDHREQEQQVESQEEQIGLREAVVKAVWASHVAPIVRKLTT